MALVALCCLVSQVALSAPSAQEILDGARETYANLTTYTDTGTVIVEEKPIGATTLREQYSFTTRYASPRQFYFDFRKPNERFVIWCPAETFHSWWSATQVHEEYAKGEGSNAFAIGAQPTAGSALLIPPLLFQGAGLQGALVNLSEPRYAGTEKINGRNTHKLTGTVRLNHWNEAIRPTTIWIDVETLLIRKVFEDTPSGLGGAIQRTTTHFDPQVNVKVDAAKFRFAVPE